MASIFFVKQNNQSKKQNLIFNSRFNHAYDSIQDILNGISIEITTVKEINEKYSKIPTRDLEIAYINSLNNFKEYKNTLDEICTISHDVLEPRHETRIVREITFIEKFLELAHSNHPYEEVLDILENNIDKIKKDLPQLDTTGLT